jgi:hypothetical protein
MRRLGSYARIADVADEHNQYCYKPVHKGLKSTRVFPGIGRYRRPLTLKFRQNILPFLL